MPAPDDTALSEESRQNTLLVSCRDGLINLPKASQNEEDALKKMMNDHHVKIRKFRKKTVSEKTYYEGMQQASKTVRKDAETSEKKQLRKIKYSRNITKTLSSWVKSLNIYISGGHLEALPIIGLVFAGVSTVLDLYVQRKDRYGGQIKTRTLSPAIKLLAIVIAAILISPFGWGVFTVASLVTLGIGFIAKISVMYQALSNYQTVKSALHQSLQKKHDLINQLDSLTKGGFSRLEMINAMNDLELLNEQIELIKIKKAGIESNVLRARRNLSLNLWVVAGSVLAVVASIASMGTGFIVVGTVLAIGCLAAEYYGRPCADRTCEHVRGGIMGVLDIVIQIPRDVVRRFIKTVSIYWNKLRGYGAVPDNDADTPALSNSDTLVLQYLDKVQPPSLPMPAAGNGVTVSTQAETVDLYRLPEICAKKRYQYHCELQDVLSYTPPSDSSPVTIIPKASIYTATFRDTSFPHQTSFGVGFVKRQDTVRNVDEKSDRVAMYASAEELKKIEAEGKLSVLLSVAEYICDLKPRGIKIKNVSKNMPLLLLALVKVCAERRSPSLKFSCELDLPSDMIQKAENIFKTCRSKSVESGGAPVLEMEQPLDEGYGSRPVHGQDRG